MSALVKVTIIFLLLITLAAGLSGPKPKPPQLTNEGAHLIFRYGIEARNILDTYANTYTKDLVMDPPVTTKMVLTEEEIAMIEAKLDEIGFLTKSTWDLVPHGSDSTLATPYSSFYLKVSYRGVTRELSWNNRNFEPGTFNGPLVELSRLLQSIIEAKPEYLCLPEPRGGYA